MSRAYVIEKLTNALDALITGPGDVRSRLITAPHCMSSLRENDFLNHLISDWPWIKHELTKFSSVENTIGRIYYKTGVKIAKRISEIYWEISNNEKYS